jgi:hypothetical protein
MGIFDDGVVKTAGIRRLDFRLKLVGPRAIRVDEDAPVVTMKNALAMELYGRSATLCAVEFGYIGYPIVFRFAGDFVRVANNEEQISTVLEQILALPFIGNTFKRLLLDSREWTMSPGCE